MRAVILVGGEGRRLQPLTETIPKPLLPLVDRPMLDHILDHLARHDVDEVVLSSPRHRERFARYGATRRASPDVRVVAEPVPLGTGGALANAVRLAGIEETFVALNGDTPTDADVTRLVGLHRAHGGAATIALTQVEDARPFGLVETDDAGRVTAFLEKPGNAASGAISAGLYVFEPEAFHDVPSGCRASVERDVFPGLLAGGAPVFGTRSSAYWIDVGTPERYLRAVADAIAGRGPCGAMRAPRIHANARVAAGAGLGETVVMEEAAIVERDADVIDSVVMRGARIGRGARVRGSILGPAAVVGAGSDLTDCVLGEGAVVREGATLRGARVPDVRT